MKKIGWIERESWTASQQFRLTSTRIHFLYTPELELLALDVDVGDGERGQHEQVAGPVDDVLHKT